MDQLPLYDHPAPLRYEIKGHLQVDDCATIIGVKTQGQKNYLFAGPATVSANSAILLAPPGTKWPKASNSSDSSINRVRETARESGSEFRYPRLSVGPIANARYPPVEL